MNTNPYKFEDLDDNSHHQQIRPELLVDSILVFIHRITYFFTCSGAYIAFFFFNSLTVGRTLAVTAVILYIIDAISSLILTFFANKISKSNKKIRDLHDVFTNNIRNETNSS